MRLRIVLSGLVIVAAPVGLAAQPVNGLYVAGSAGINLQKSQSITIDRPIEAPGQNASTAGNGPSSVTLPSATGPAGTGSVGYGFGNGWRVEAEGSRRR
jgi:OmpA-OmpF porin, OOP family